MATAKPTGKLTKVAIVVSEAKKKNQGLASPIENKRTLPKVFKVRGITRDMAGYINGANIEAIY